MNDMHSFLQGALNTNLDEIERARGERARQIDRRAAIDKCHDDMIDGLEKNHKDILAHIEKLRACELHDCDTAIAELEARIERLDGPQQIRPATFSPEEQAGKIVGLKAA